MYSGSDIVHACLVCTVYKHGEKCILHLHLGYHQKRLSSRTRISGGTMGRPRTESLKCKSFGADTQSEGSPEDSFLGILDTECTVIAE